VLSQVVDPLTNRTVIAATALADAPDVKQSTLVAVDASAAFDAKTRAVAARASVNQPLVRRGKIKASIRAYTYLADDMRRKWPIKSGLDASLNAFSQPAMNL